MTTAPPSRPLAADVIEAWQRANPQSVPPAVSRWEVGRMEVFNDNLWPEIFRDMRAQAPINKVCGTILGDYWNVSTHKAVQYIESLPELFSSSYEHGGVSIAEPPKGVEHNVRLPMFIAMDRPDHTPRRRTVANAVTPAEMVKLQGEIRERTGRVLDGLPVGEQFDWVSRVSVDLTTSMLAILFDFPRADAHLLAYWSDWFTAIEAGHIPEVMEGRLAAARDMTAKYDAQNPAALRRLVAAGTKLRGFSKEIMDAGYKASMEVFAAHEAKSPEFRKIHQDMRAFQRDQVLWSKFSEWRFDSYIAGLKL